MRNATIPVMLEEYKNASDKADYAKDYFYDWFCSHKAIFGKAKNLMGKVKRISNSKKFDASKCYVFFKNNYGYSPLTGVEGLYDDFRICDAETGDVIFTVEPNLATSRGKKLSLVYGAENNFEEPLFKSNEWQDVVDWFNA